MNKQTDRRRRDDKACITMLVMTLCQHKETAESENVFAS